MLSNPDSGSIFIQRGDVRHTGTYTVDRGMITVRGPHGSWTTQLGDSSRSIDSFAKLLLGKLVDQANRK
jgi:hypothetical protein